MEVTNYGVGDLVEIIAQVTDDQIETVVKEYQKQYIFKTDQIDAVNEQAKYEMGINTFINKHRIHAFYRYI